MSVEANSVKTGDKLLTDDGFTCVPAEKEVIVEEDEGGKFVRCAEGKHYLDGQLERGLYIGLRRPDVG